MSRVLSAAFGSVGVVDCTCLSHQESEPWRDLLPASLPYEAGCVLLEVEVPWSPPAVLGLFATGCSMTITSASSAFVPIPGRAGGGGGGGQLPLGSDRAGFDGTCFVLGCHPALFARSARLHSSWAFLSCSDCAACCWASLSFSWSRVCLSCSSLCFAQYLALVAASAFCNSALLRSNSCNWVVSSRSWSWGSGSWTWVVISCTCPVCCDTSSGFLFSPGSLGCSKSTLPEGNCSGKICARFGDDCVDGSSFGSRLHPSNSE